MNIIRMSLSARSKIMSTTCLIIYMCGVSTTAFSDAMTIVNDNVGIGTDTPSGALHILRTDGVKPSIVIETQGGATSAKWEIKSNPSTGRLTFKDLNGTTTPFKFSPEAVSNLFRVGIVNPNTVDIGGDLIVTGNCSEYNGACADFVFEDDYELRSLEELNQFITANNHLPNVPSADAIKKNGVNLANFSGRLLEKIEELTLYTLQQEETITSLTEIVNSQSEMMEALGSRLEQVEQTAE